MNYDLLDLRQSIHGLLFVGVAKQVKAAAAGSGGWPSAAVAIRRIRILRSFQDD